MSSVQEKLEHFNEVILKDAAFERDRILQQLRTEMEERIRLEKRKFQEQADAFFIKENAAIENEKNSLVSRAIIESRQLLIKTREDIIEAVFSDAGKILYEFVDQEEYFPYLAAEIRRLYRLAGEGELTVYISKKDMDRFSSRLEAVKTELPPHTVFDVTGKDIVGGCQVLNRTRGILLNNTLFEKLEAQREGFFEICGLKIE